MDVDTSVSEIADLFNGRTIKPVVINYSGFLQSWEANIISKIIKQAIADIVACPNAISHCVFAYKHCLEKYQREFDSADAQLFLALNNIDFCDYCSMLGVEPEILHKQCWRIINLYKNRSNRRYAIKGLFE